MQNPDSNLPPQSQPWGRWNDEDHDVIKARQDELEEQLRQIKTAKSDPLLGVQIAAIEAQLAKTTAELISLYAAMGATYPPPPPPPPAPPTPPSSWAVYEVGAGWSRTWGTSSYYTGGGEYTNSTYLYQGSAPENKVGMFGFNTAPVRNKAFRAVYLYMSNINAPWSSSFVATLGTHGEGAPPVGKPGRQNGFDVGWNRGEAKWIPIPEWAWNSLSNGSILGFTVGASGASNSNSAYFRGVGTTDPPRLKIEYKV